MRARKTDARVLHGKEKPANVSVLSHLTATFHIFVFLFDSPFKCLFVFSFTLGLSREVLARSSFKALTAGGQQELHTPVTDKRPLKRPLTHLHTKGLMTIISASHLLVKSYL